MPLTLSNGLRLDSRLTLSPLVLLLDLCLEQVVSKHRDLPTQNTHLLFRSEVINDVEQFTDLLRGFPFDHVGNSLAPNITLGKDNVSRVNDETLGDVRTAKA